MKTGKTKNYAKMILCVVLAAATVTLSPMECNAMKAELIMEQKSAAKTYLTQEEKLYREVSKAVNEGQKQLDFTFKNPVKDKELFIEKCRQAIYQVRRDYPESFLDNHTDFAYYGDQDGYFRVVYSFQYLNLTEKQKQKLLHEVDSIVQKGKERTKTQVELLCYFQETIRKRVTYDSKAATGTSNDDPTAFHAYGALMEGEAVCQGYAYAFKMLCDKAKIPCWIVTGYYKEPHAWNYVLLDGKYYQVDITWDDAENRSSHSEYFLAGEKYSKDYTIEDHSAPGPLAKSSYFSKDCRQ